MAVEPERCCARCQATPIALIGVDGYRGLLCWPCYKRWVTFDGEYPEALELLAKLTNKRRTGNG